MIYNSNYIKLRLLKLVKGLSNYWILLVCVYIFQDGSILHSTLLYMVCCVF